MFPSTLPKLTDAPPPLAEFLRNTDAFKDLFKRATDPANISQVCNLFLLTEPSNIPLKITHDVDFGAKRITPPVDTHAIASLFSPSSATGDNNNNCRKVDAGAPLDAVIHLTTSNQGHPAIIQTNKSIGFFNMAPPRLFPNERVFLLCGVAVPPLPKTFAVFDEAGLFWSSDDKLDGGDMVNNKRKVVELGPGQEYQFPIALNCADGVGRNDERGLLCQLLVFFLAIPHDCQFHHTMMMDSTTTTGPPKVYHITNNNISSNGINNPHHHQELGYTIVPIARRISVALVPNVAAVMHSILNVDAKKFIPAQLKQLFDQIPTQYAVYGNNNNNSPHLTKLGHARLDPSYCKPAFQQRGGAAETSGQMLGHSYDFARKYAELLLLEEETIEQHVSMFDMYYTRFNIALFINQDVKYVLLGPGKDTFQTAVPGIDDLERKAYRGMSLVGLDNSNSKKNAIGLRLTDMFKYKPKYKEAFSHITNAWALGHLNVPGLLEGRPGLAICDTVYLRLVGQETFELACIVAGIEGSSVFLLMPDCFWQVTSVNSLIQRALLSSTSPSYENLKRAAAMESLEMVHKQAWKFDGLVHVRFSFDRKQFRSMHDALWKTTKLLRYKFSSCLEPWLLNNQATLDLLVQKLPSVTTVNALAQSLKQLGLVSVNEQQKQAIAAVLLGGGASVPFAIYGPPGTGKTLTLVELALQLLAQGPGNKLLLCAPQQYSADLLVAALSKAGIRPDEMVRLNDPRRPVYTVLDACFPYCIFDEKKRMFSLPIQKQYGTARVVVTSCASASLLNEKKSGAEKTAAASIVFSHILIDEAGQAMIPEILIPLCHLNNNSNEPASIVLAGDPKQLGPVVRSKEAAAQGLGKSLLELLINNVSRTASLLKQQKQQQQNGVCDNDNDNKFLPVTMLVQNYRSHQSLLSLPSKLFYNDKLLAAADACSVLAPRWRLPGEEEEEDDDDGGKNKSCSKNNNKTTKYKVKGNEFGFVEDDNDADDEEEEEEEYKDNNGQIPSNLMFYGVLGQQMREGEAPSFFNPIEAATVLQLIQGLLDQAPEIQPTDLGVMATYRKQVQKIRLLLREHKLGAVRVGTLDDFQGQESKIIIVSTTLSRPDTLPTTTNNDDNNNSIETQCIGFWHNPRRFNVAITRAKALLVVVGHPAVLMEDASWREFIRHCVSNGCYRGAGAGMVARSSLMTSGTGGKSDEEAELEGTIAQMVKISLLLGAGDASLFFPESLDDMYAVEAAEMDDAPWRIML